MKKYRIINEYDYQDIQDLIYRTSDLVVFNFTFSFPENQTYLYIDVKNEKKLTDMDKLVLKELKKSFLKEV